MSLPHRNNLEVRGRKRTMFGLNGKELQLSKGINL